jgi:signal transduction histidine kinase
MLSQSTPPSPAARAADEDLFLDAQKQALELVVKGEPLHQVLTFLASVVEHQSEGAVVASILLLDREGRLRAGAGPSLPEDYMRAIDGLKAQPMLGTCSAAAATARVVITKDFASDPGWSTLKHLPLGLGLVAAWSQPIVDRRGRVLGTFGTYFRECREPSAAERQVVEILSHTASLAIERAHAEEAHREEERLKAEFIATLSHELRNPLSPLVTALNLLAKVSDDPNSVRRLHGMMSRQVEQLVRLVDDLLDVSRASRGDVPLQQESVDIDDLVTSALETSGPLLESKRFTVEVVRTGEPLLVRGDRLRLRQVVGNLLSNAARYTPDGGRIGVEAGSRGDTVQVVVRDSGVGIAPSDLERIFNPFVRLSHAETDAPSGLGLGLPLARRLTEMHGGTLSAWSAGPGTGSEFTMSLPRLAS